MPINKSEIKKKINFNGVTEFLGNLNNSKTYMIMKGNSFSIIPLTTIPLKRYQIFSWKSRKYRKTFLNLKENNINIKILYSLV